VMEEQVAPFSFDESKTLVRNNFLNRPLRHSLLSTRTNLDFRFPDKAYLSPLVKKADGAAQEVAGA
jgi:hypothetical protein